MRGGSWHLDTSSVAGWSQDTPRNSDQGEPGEPPLKRWQRRVLWRPVYLTTVCLAIGTNPDRIVGAGRITFKMPNPIATIVSFAAFALLNGTANAAGSTGGRVDHTGRGGVEITQCGANLCGKVVWLKEGTDKRGCGIQIIGNVKPVGKDTWDGGWILDPEKNAKFSVELK